MSKIPPLDATGRIPLEYVHFDSSFINPRIDPDRYLRHEMVVGNWKTHQFVVQHPFGSIATVTCYRRPPAGQIHLPPSWVPLDPGRYTVEIADGTVLVIFKFTPAKDGVRIVVRP